MKAYNPTIHEDYLKNLKAGAVPVKFKNVSITNNGTCFFNTFRGSTIEEGVVVDFKADENCSLTINELKTKANGTFTISVTMKWFGELEKHETRNGTMKNLRECIVYDGTDDIMLTIWGDLLDLQFIERSQWYIFENVNLKHYFGLKLATTPMTTAKECEPVREIDWNDVDITKYERIKSEANALMNPSLCCPVIVNVCIEIFDACSNPICKEKVTIVPGERSVQCIHCSRSMTPTMCSTAFHAVLQFQNVELNLPLHVLEEFLNEPVVKKYKDNVKNLVDKVLYFKNVDFHYNTKNIITKISQHSK